MSPSSSLSARIRKFPLLSRPPAARVSGVVEESPGNLEYEVSLYRETAAIDNHLPEEVPVDQAVPIGTQLQLRASINTQSGNLYSLITVNNHNEASIEIFANPFRQPGNT